MSLSDELHDLFRHNSPGTAVALGMELIREQFKKMNTENTWIKMSDRKPTEADLPVIFGGFYGEEASAWAQIYCGNFLMTNSSWTHWTPQLKVQPPPAKEPTRDELDREAFVKEFGEDPGFPASADDFREKQWHQHRRAWIAALAYERKTLRDLIAQYTANDITIQQLVAEIKERVK